MHLESEKNSGDNDHDAVGDCARQWISEDETEIINNKEIHTTSKHLEDIQHKAVKVYQEAF
jgi:hypothetical protein